MSTRAVLFVGLPGLFLGIAIGFVLTGPHAVQANPAAAHADPAFQLAQLRAAHAELRADYERLQQERDRQTQRTALEPTPERVPAEAAPTATAVGKEVGDDPVISFGVWRDEPALRTADWTDMGSRARDVVKARKTGIGGGQPREMAALEKKALRELRRHLGGIAAQRQELRGHPVVIVNLMASHLQQAGQPLLPRQLAAIEADGGRYEAAAARLQRDMLSRRDELASERKLRSIKLRKAHVDRIVEGVLTREQWNVLFDPKTKGLLYYDVYQVGGLELERPNSSVYWRNVRADAREHLRLFLLTEWEIARADLQLLDGTVDEWIDTVLRLPRVPGHPSSALHIDEVLPCAEVHTRFQKRVLARLAHDAARVQSIRDNPVFAVFPRLRNPN